MAFSVKKSVEPLLKSDALVLLKNHVGQKKLELFIVVETDMSSKVKDFQNRDILITLRFMTIVW